MPLSVFQILFKAFNFQGLFKTVLYIQVFFKPVLLQTVKTKMKCNINVAFKTFIFLTYNLTPLDMYNGLFQGYCIKPEVRIH